MNNLVVYQDKFAASGLRIFERAVEESRRRNQNHISLSHFLIALDAEEDGSFRYLVGKLRRDHGLTADVVPTDRVVEKLMEWSPRYEGKGVRVGPDTKHFLRKALRIARSNQREKIEAVDLLSAFVEIAPILFVRPDKVREFDSKIY
jgi:ATP-dependent Clp protease ATP-binding subunit ClpA